MAKSKQNECTQQLLKKQVKTPGNKGFVTIPDCVLDHVLSNKTFGEKEMLYYFSAYFLATINSNLGKGNAVIFSAKKLLFLSCKKNLKILATL
jgi:hypothetical protein